MSWARLDDGDGLDNGRKIRILSYGNPGGESTGHVSGSPDFNPSGGVLHVNSHPQGIGSTTVMERGQILRYSMVFLIFAFVVGETYVTFRMFHQLNLAWQPTPGDMAAHPATMAQVCFLIVAFLLMFILFKIRQVLLLAFVTGQLTLYFVSFEYEIFRVVLPFYGVIALNGLYVLALYFLFSRQRWAPSSIDVETLERDLR